MKKMMMLAVLGILFGVFGCSSSTGNDSSSVDPDLVGTWVRSSSSYDEKIIFNSDNSFTRTYKDEIINSNSYDLENDKGTCSFDLNSNPKKVVNSFTCIKETYTNGTVTKSSSDQKTQTMYYKVENSQLYVTGSSSSWTGAEIYTKQ